MSFVGTIFEIREFSLYDGPGIRTTVFFKGCPLRCRWCHNPEGLRPEPQLLVNSLTCTHCGKCAEVCTHDPCIVCGMCANVCPTGSRRVCGVSYRTDTLVEELVRHEDVFRSSGGGVTFSGGEPLMQPDFASALAAELHMRGVHVTLETSGCADLETYRKVVESVDFVFQDIKHPDPEKHRFYTGRDNVAILGNLAWLRQSGKPFIARIPLIPTVNMSQEDLTRVASLLRDTPNLLRVELLPYHTTAGAKYHLLGRSYHPGFDDTAFDPKTLYTEECLEPFRKFGIECKYL